MPKTVKAVIFDPFHPEGILIREEVVQDDLKTLQGVVQGCIEGIYPGNFVSELEGVHGYVNEEFLYTHPEWQTRPWRLGPYETLLGPAIFIGSDDYGEEADCPVSAETLAKHIQIPNWVGEGLKNEEALRLLERLALAPDGG